MATYGLTVSGFVAKTQQNIRDEINAAMQVAFGPSVDLSDGSILGQIVGIMSADYAELWDLAQTVNSSTDPDSAVDTALDSICALTGTRRTAAIASKVVLTLTGDDTTLVAAGSQASVSVTGALFGTDADATLAALTAWATTHAYVAGDRRSNGGNCYVCTVAGTSAGSGGPTTEDDAITDGTVTWRFIGNGLAAVDAPSTALLTGPTVATSGSIVKIETPVAGWTDVKNLLDAAVGSNIETNEDLRVKREVELAAPGTSPIDAIRSELLDVADVTSVHVFMNTGDATDADGVPPHAVEALVQGGADQAIYDQLLKSVAAGIATTGTSSGTSTDTASNVWAVSFSRPDLLSIYATLTIIVESGTYPEDGDDLLKAALVTFGAAQRTGKNVVASSVGAQAFKVAGVLDVVTCFIGTSPSPGASTTIQVSPRQLALFDTSRIVISKSFGVP